MFVCRVHTRVRGADAGAIDSLEINRIALHAKQRELLLEGFRLDTRGDQRPKDHVATGAGEAVEVKGFHK